MKYPCPLVIALNKSSDLHIVLLRSNFTRIGPLIHADTCLGNVACDAGSLWDGALLPR